MKKLSSISNRKTLLSFEAEEIARQLILIDLEYMQSVEFPEFMNTNWTKNSIVFVLNIS
jgi:hypothetical protein